MAFHSLSHDMSLPHFSEHHLEERSSLAAEQLGLRHSHHRLLQQEKDGIDLQQHVGLGQEARGKEGKDLGNCGDKVSSLVNEPTGDIKLGAPTWLSSAILRQQNPHSYVEAGEEGRKWCGCAPGSRCVRCSFLHLQISAAPGSGSTSSTANTMCAQWLPRPMSMLSSSSNNNNNNKLQQQQNNPSAAGGREATAELVGEEVPSESIMALSTQQQSHGSADINQSPVPGRGLLDLHSDTANSSELVESGGRGGGGGGEPPDNHALWQNARFKADILSHPLYEQLLSAHVACLRIATPVDQLPRIDAQLAQSQHVVAKYSVLGHNHLLVGDDKELDQFMTHYVLLLCSFKEQLQQHVRVHAMEAVMACWELEQSLLSLTGVSPGEGTGATMSDDEDDQADSDANLYDGGLDGQDTVGFGPLIPTETERSLMERVRQELKHDLKQGYRARIVDVREEILRKRRAGKLPGDTTSLLKAWWQSHSKWPYPTEDEKARLVQETGLQLKQINNWFINQRKRNWHSNPSSSTVLKAKRKRE